MLIQDRNDSRRVFYDVWDKHARGAVLEPLESLVLAVIEFHPEYHAVLENEQDSENDFTADSDKQNPFLHMGLHIALQEQINTNRPPGITSLYQALLTKYADEHQLQHKIMDCLEESLWNAQRSGTMPDEQVYMDSLRKLTG